VSRLHVNGDHPEEMSRELRKSLRRIAISSKDVIIDLIAYRRLGHNELDEPAFTQYDHV
jgi:probable 2-oxoglutarate dehydrogenase E1 component DHKTD1